MRFRLNSASFENRSVLLPIPAMPCFSEQSRYQCPGRTSIAAFLLTEAGADFVFLLSFVEPVLPFVGDDGN